MEMLLKSWKL